MGREYTVLHAACLAAQLPRGSRLYRAINPDTEWGLSEVLLNNIEYWLHWLAWSRTDDGMKGRNVPKPIWSPDEHGGSQGEAMTIEELEEFLSRPRKEA